MIAEILATGDEIRTGALIDSNSAYIAQKLEENGVAVARHSCVGDDLDRLAEIIREIGSRADLAVVSGGLGPTGDDLTAEAAARAAGTPLVLDTEAMASIEAFFRARNRPVSDANRKPAYLPRGAGCLPNPVGTAPGFWMTLRKCRMFFVPGVPFEMRRLLEDYILPYVTGLQADGRRYRLVKTLTVFGLPESVVGERLAGLESRLPGIKLGLRAKFPEIHVKLYVNGSDKPGLEALMTRGAEWVGEHLGDAVISAAGESMPAVVGRLLREADGTLALAESCTGGLIANWVTDVPGSSDYFLFGGVTYSNATKQNVLGVAPEILKRHGAVDEQTVQAMAEGARRLARATFGLATSGIAGPGGGTSEKPVGTVCIGLAAPGGSRGQRYHFTYGDREMNKQMFAMKALDLLRRELLGG